MKKLYVLRQKADCRWCYEDGLVVRASNVKTARLIASQRHTEPGVNIWLDPTYSTCTVIPLDGDDEIIDTYVWDY